MEGGRKEKGKKKIPAFSFEQLCEQQFLFNFLETQPYEL